MRGRGRSSSTGRGGGTAEGPSFSLRRLVSALWRDHNHHDKDSTSPAGRPQSSSPRPVLPAGGTGSAQRRGRATATGPHRRVVAGDGITQPSTTSPSSRPPQEALRCWLLCLAALVRLGQTAVRAWRAFVVLVAGWLPPWLRKHLRRRHRAEPSMLRQTSDFSVSGDECSPGTTPLGGAGASGPVGGRAASHRHKRRNVYYDVEEGGFRPLQRLMFMRHRFVEGPSPAGGGPQTPVVGPHDRLGPHTLPLMAGTPLEGRLGSSAGDHVLLSSPFVQVCSGTDGGAAGDAGSSSGRPEDGYLQGAWGQTVCDGAFVLVAQLGAGAFSTVWLAVDVKGVTGDISPALMLRHRSDERRYNATAAVMRQAFAFVVLKISRGATAFRRACEKEFETHQQLFLQLQREGFSLERFLLFPLVLHEEGPRGAHVVQVGDACGPSLLDVVLHAPPSHAAAAEDHAWRLRLIRAMIRNLITGLAQLHACGVLHTDIKPENVLFTLPAFEVLRKMAEDPVRAPSDGSSCASVRVSDGGCATGMDRELLLAEHRLPILGGVGPWLALKSAHRDTFLATDEDDVVGLLGAIKVSDLGNAVFLQTVQLAEQAAASAAFGGGQGQGSPVAGLQAAASAHAFQTREYRAPEVIVGLRPLTAMLGPPMDVWSVGCVAFELVTGSYLFNPRAAAQGPDAGPSDGTESAMDVVHLSMMQEICSAEPFTAAGGPRRANDSLGQSTIDVDSVIRSGGLDSARLFAQVHPLSSDCLTGRPLLRHVLQQRVCGPSLLGPRVEADLDRFADFLGRIFRWNPAERPSMAELLQHDWLVCDGIS